MVWWGDTGMIWGDVSEEEVMEFQRGQFKD